MLLVRYGAMLKWAPLIPRQNPPWQDDLNLTIACESAGVAFLAVQPCKSYPTLSTGTFDTQLEVLYMFMFYTWNIQCS
jgi:hypothetical protein